MSTNFNILIIGVGGQGIGLLSEALIRAAHYAKISAKGVDTHGLAQRGGTVTSQIRLGSKAFSPLIQEGSADIVIALERHEALRGMNTYLKNGGDLVFYDAVWQALDVRMRQTEEINTKTIEAECKRREISYHRVFKDDLKNSKMQNVVVLGYISKHKLIPGISKENYLQAIKDLLKGDLLEENLKVFEQ
ncbi:2-oxoacid:acceptor oxidoreductase family protein [bacterium]|nr:2-oxoacid:acceptor oxidoreductase family protein [bacterium]